jgi:ribosomal protein S18 acetylase RimI-like enzyme
MYAHIKTEVLANPRIAGIRLYVAHDNRRAQRVYEQLGFRNDHYIMYEWMPDAQS